MKTALLFFLMCLTASAQTFIDKYGPYSKFQGDGSGVTGVTATLANNIAAGVKGTNWVIDLRNSQTLQLLGPSGGDGYIFKWFTDRLEMSNAVSLSWMRFNDGMQFGHGANTTVLNLSQTTGDISATTFTGSGANLTALPASQLTGTVADARHSANVMLISTNATAPTLTPNTNAAGGMNFGATAVIQPGWADVTFTNNLGQTILRQVSFVVAYNTGAGTQPSSCNLGTNTVSPAFAFMPAVTVTEVCTNGSGWLANGLQRQLIANNSTTSGCSVQQVGATLLAGTTYYVSVTMTGR